MSRITLYLGSDHVIHHPQFPINKTQLRLFSDVKEAVSLAYHKNKVGVLNVYQLDINEISEKDVIRINGDYSICSTKGLDALSFVSASFVQE